MRSACSSVVVVVVIIVVGVLDGNGESPERDGCKMLILAPSEAAEGWLQPAGQRHPPKATTGGCSICVIKKARDAFGSRRIAAAQHWWGLRAPNWSVRFGLRARAHSSTLARAAHGSAKI